MKKHLENNNTYRLYDLHNYVILNAQNFKFNAQGEFECTNYGITKSSNCIALN